MEKYKELILNDYFEDVKEGYGWVEYGKVIIDMQIGYDVDITEKDLDEYLSKADLIEVACYNEDKILIVNENLDFELDIVPQLEKE